MYSANIVYFLGAILGLEILWSVKKYILVPIRKKHELQKYSERLVWSFTVFSSVRN